MSKNRNEPEPATQIDVDDGKAVFWIPDSRSKVFDLGIPLPVEAVISKDLEVGDDETIPAGTAVSVIQAEIVDGVEVLLGFVTGETRGVCRLEEARIEKSQP